MRVGFKGDLSIRSEYKALPDGVKGGADVPRRDPAGGATADENGVHTRSSHLTAPAPDLGYQGPVVRLEQRLQADVGVEIAVRALAHAERDVQVEAVRPEVGHTPAAASPVRLAPPARVIHSLRLIAK